MEGVPPLTPVADVTPIHDSHDPAIETFVKTSELFTYVREDDKVQRKTAAIQELNRVNNQPGIENKLDALAHCTSIHDTILQDPDIEHIITLAHIKGKIDAIQLGTFFYHNSIIKRYGLHNLREVPLFGRDGRPTPEAVDIMTRQLGGPEKIDQWFELMAKHPPSEHRLLLANPISSNLPPSTDNSDETYLSRLKEVYYAPPSKDRPTVMDIAYQGAKVETFNRYYKSYNAQTYQKIFPSFGMADALFETNVTHIRSIPRFGSKDLVRENGLTCSRDISLRSSYQPTPKRADHFQAPGDEYVSHDLCFHARLCSHIPEEHQRLFIKVGDLLMQQALGKSDFPYFLADRCYDMECPEYRTLKKRSPADSFLNSLSHFIPSAISRYSSTQLDHLYARTDLTLEEKDKLALEIVKTRKNPPDLGPIDHWDELIESTLVDYLSSLPSRTPFEQSLLDALPPPEPPLTDSSQEPTPKSPSSSTS